MFPVPPDLLKNKNLTAGSSTGNLKYIGRSRNIILSLPIQFHQDVSIFKLSQFFLLLTNLHFASFKMVEV